MSNGYAASVMRDNMDNQAGLYCTPRHETSLLNEINAERAKGGLKPLTLPSEVSEKVNQPRKHSHYFKPVGHLTEIDVYRICEMYVDDRSGATQHAIKKLLLPGERGAGKSREKDLQEAVDTLNRKLQMMQEDEAAL